MMLLFWGNTDAAFAARAQLFLSSDFLHPFCAPGSVHLSSLSLPIPIWCQQHVAVL